MIPHLVRAWSRLDARLQRAPQLIADAVGAGLVEGLSLAEMEAASLEIYNGTRGRARLFDWEHAWFDAMLPPAPATILVTGAGAGVEVEALAARGYIVDAAEPAPASYAKLRGGSARAVTRGDHLDALRGGPYDAVLFGWGSFTCVLSPAVHRACLAAAARICAGPILLSVWLVGAAGPRPTHALARLGRGVGRAIASARGEKTSGDIRFRHWCGFGYAFEPSEIDALAAGIHRTARWGVGLYPHVGLMPVADPAA